MYELFSTEMSLHKSSLKIVIFSQIDFYKKYANIRIVKMEKYKIFSNFMSDTIRFEECC